jgi:Fis family transcriptional regulator
MGLKCSTVGTQAITTSKRGSLLKRELDALVTHMHGAGMSYTDAVRQFKRRFILEVLARHKGNQCKAAVELGMHRNTLSRTLAELDLNTAQIRRGMRRPVMSERPMLGQRIGNDQRPRLMATPTGRIA